MHSHFASRTFWSRTFWSRTFWICFTLLALAAAGCLADDTNPKKDKPVGFTNGQNGTPNLPIAPAMIVDKNRMRGSLDQLTRDASAIAGQRGEFIQKLYPAAQNVVADLAQNVPYARLRSDYSAFRNLIVEEYNQTQKDAATLQLPDHFLYLGAEARAGADKPVFGPEMTLEDTRNGLEFGLAGYYQSAYADGTSRRDSIGLSLKYSPQNFTSYTANDIKKSQELLEKINNLGYLPSSSPSPDLVKSLYDAVQPVNAGSRADIVKELTTVSPLLSLSPLRPPGVPAPTNNIINKITSGDISSALAQDIQTLNDSSTHTLRDFVEGIQKPAVALLAGDQLFHGGDVFNAGVTASLLHPFGDQGQTGVTGVAAAQYYHADLSGFHRDGLRTGLAAIFQDSTLYLTPAKNLSPPWHYKLGLEYTSPIFGLHETYAEFVRYRDPRSYAEITLTAGKDGLRKDYVDVSVGQSFTF